MKPDFIVDISDVIEIRLEAISAYSSQFYDPNSKEPETPISSKQFFDFLTARARDMGRIIGTEYGEGFVVERIQGVGDLNSLI